MSIFLLSITTAGIRNLDSEQRIDFYSKSSLRRFDPTRERVRGIYGPNGSGKTSFMLSMWVVSQLFLDPGFIQKQGTDYFADLFTQRPTGPREFSFSCEFLSYIEHSNRSYEVDGVYKYDLTLGLDVECRITNEKLSYLGNRNKHDSWVTVFESRNGRVENLSINALSGSRNQIMDLMQNVVAKTCYLNALRNAIRQLGLTRLITDGDMLHKSDRALVDAVYFFKSISVRIMEDDIHTEKTASTRKHIDDLFQLEPQIFKERIAESFTLKEDEVLIPRDEYENYKSFLKRAALFIKAFKPGLVDIVPDATEKGDSYKCKTIFVYENSRIDLSNESAGIRKLFTLFGDVANVASGGGILFIDELDAHLSSIFLKEIVDLVTEFGNGQLVFTCHSLDPMHSLAGLKKSLYFLAEGKQAFVWTKNAHYKPYIAYPEGKIPGLSFSSLAETLKESLLKVD